MCLAKSETKFLYDQQVWQTSGFFTQRHRYSVPFERTAAIETQKSGTHSDLVEKKNLNQQEKESFLQERYTENNYNLKIIRYQLSSLK